MNQFFSVWGKNGSGKSTTAANLACAFAERGLQTALVGANRFYGSIQYFFDMEFSPEQSLRSVLTGKESLVIKTYFAGCPRVKNLFVASLADSDDCAGYQKLRVDTVVRFINLVKASFPVTLVDCEESTEAPLSMLSLTNSDKIIYVSRPDIQSAVFAKAYAPIISGLNISDRLVTVFIDEGGRGGLDEYNLFGGGHWTVPYCREIAFSDCNASLLTVSRDTGRAASAYRRAINALADMMSPKEVEEAGGNAGTVVEDNTGAGAENKTGAAEEDGAAEETGAAEEAADERLREGEDIG